MWYTLSKLTYSKSNWLEEIFVTVFVATVCVSLGYLAFYTLLWDTMLDYVAALR